MEGKVHADGASLLSALNSPSRLLEELTQGPVIGPGTPAYRLSRGLMELNEPLLKQVFTREEGEPRFEHTDLPKLFVAALADPQVAAEFRGCSVGYKVVMASSWDELLALHPLWCPAYVSFVQSFRGATTLLDPCGADTLDHLIRLDCNPIRAVVLALLRKDDARAVIRHYAEKVLRIDVAKVTAEHLELDNDKRFLELGQGLAARALLFAVLRLPEAAERARETVRTVIGEVEGLWGDGDIATMRLCPLLFSGRSFQTWGLVHSLLDLGDLWEEHFARRALAATRSCAMDLPGDLSIPEVGGPAFGDLCRRVCDEIADWYSASSKTDAPPDPGQTCAVASEKGASLPRPHERGAASQGRRRAPRRVPKGSLPVKASAYAVHCEKMALLCRGTPVPLPPVAWNLLQRLAYERGKIVPRNETIAGEQGNGRATARDGRRELGRCLGSEVANALVITEKGRGYRLRNGKDGVQVKGLGEVGLVFGREDG